MKPLALAASLLLFAAPTAFAGGSVDAGKAKSATCAACHGPDGNSPTADFPRIAGQPVDYLVHTLMDYKAGIRKNAIMSSQAANLSKQDIEDLSAYYSKQTGVHLKR